MSDAESFTALAPGARPSVGGKSLDVLERPKYKSYRKKYRKIRVKFDATLEENKRLFKEDHKLQLIAKRLREELDGLLDLCLDLNQSPEIPAALRFDVRLPRHGPREFTRVPEELTLEHADTIVSEATGAFADGSLSSVDLHVIKEEVLSRLAMQNVKPLNTLQATVTKRPELRATVDESNLPVDLVGEELTGYMSIEQETAYLQRLDDQLDNQLGLARAKPSKESDQKSLTDLTPKELERQIELLNPQSQHNWLKTHTKLHADVDDADGSGAHEVKQTRRRGPNKNLAKQVGDRAVERAREGYSPGAGSAYDDDDDMSLGFIDDHPAMSSGRKKTKDPDGTYRSKGNKSSTPGVAKGKRKRNSGDDPAGSSNGSAKKAKVASLVE